MRRRLRAITVRVCVTVVVCALLISVASSLKILHGRFNWAGARWELVCRGGTVSIDNRPQRTFEITETADADFHNRGLWEAEHDRLRGDMERAPYGPEYTAARLRMDAWEQVHGIAWPKLKALPTTPLVEHRVYLLWIVLVPLIAAVALRWIDSDRTASSKSAMRFPLLLIRLVGVAACVAVAVVWIKSYRTPPFFCVYGPRSTYGVTAVRGKVSFGLPQLTDPVKLAAVQAIADRVQNSDLIWTVDPNVFKRNHAPAAGLGITTDLRRDSALEALEACQDESETAHAMLEALHDPDRYLAAHAFLAELRSQQSFRQMRLQRNMSGTSIGRTTYANSRYANLNIQLTPEQAAVKTATHIPTPNVLPGQLPAIELQWHKQFDKWTQPHSLGYATLLLLVPLGWIFSIWRRRHRPGPNQCLACGYDLTGNISGICPECGRTVSPASALTGVPSGAAS